MTDEQERERELHRQNLRLAIAELVRQMPFIADDLRAGIEDGLKASEIDQDAE